MPDTWLSKINWSEDGLIPVIAQEADSGKILMVAWMNRDALKLTVEKREAVYWSRSRKNFGIKVKNPVTFKNKRYLFGL